MTRDTNARLAGFTYLLYIGLAFPAMVLFGRATDAQGVPAKLARIAEHATDMRVAIVLTVLTCFTALGLAVTLYALTRDQDADIALLALTCRVGEGVLSAIFILGKLELLWLATADGASTSDAGAVQALGALLLTGM